MIDGRVCRWRSGSGGAEDRRARSARRAGSRRAPRRGLPCSRGGGPRRARPEERHRQASGLVDVRRAKRAAAPHLLLPGAPLRRRRPPKRRRPPRGASSARPRAWPAKALREEREAPTVSASPRPRSSSAREALAQLGGGAARIASSRIPSPRSIATIGRSSQIPERRKSSRSKTTGRFDRAGGCEAEGADSVGEPVQRRRAARPGWRRDRGLELEDVQPVDVAADFAGGRELERLPAEAGGAAPLTAARMRMSPPRSTVQAGRKADERGRRSSGAAERRAARSSVAVSTHAFFQSEAARKDCSATAATVWQKDRAGRTAAFIGLEPGRSRRTRRLAAAASGKRSSSRSAIQQARRLGTCSSMKLRTSGPVVS